MGSDRHVAPLAHEGAFRRLHEDLATVLVESSPGWGALSSEFAVVSLVRCIFLGVNERVQLLFDVGQAAMQRLPVALLFAQTHWSFSVGELADVDAGGGQLDAGIGAGDLAKADVVLALAEAVAGDLHAAGGRRKVPLVALLPAHSASQFSRGAVQGAEPGRLLPYCLGAFLGFNHDFEVWALEVGLAGPQLGRCCLLVSRRQVVRLHSSHFSMCPK